jgi:hypothetical protein
MFDFDATAQHRIAQAYPRFNFDLCPLRTDFIVGQYG